MACSISGGLVYRGKKFPELHGAYLFGDWETRRLWAARFDGDRTREMPEIARPSVRFVAFSENAQREVYFLDQEGGTVHTLEKNDAGAQNANFPTTLSATGLFASVSDHRPAGGVVPFKVNARQWQDGAEVEHWAAFPGLSSVTLHTTGKPLAGMVYWHNFRMHFPKDAVLMRTMSLGGQRVETQLMHYDGVDWRGYAYVWRDDQTDADLAPADGTEKEVRWGDRKHMWPFLSRSQCLSCHSNQSEYALAFLPEQLNRSGPDGRNQLIALTEAGYIRRAGNDGNPLPPFDAASVTSERKVPDPTDESQPLEARARGYLHGNCGHCHSDHGGGTVALRMQYSVPAGEMKAIGVRPTRGDFSLPDAEIIKPGDPFSSTLFFRMAKFGRDRMPHIGSERPDEAGLKLVQRWIAGMNGGGDAAGAGHESAPVEQQLASPAAALPLALQVGFGEMKPAERQAVLAAAAKLPAGLVRDLFEGYLPASESERKLGSSPRPRTILALAGDAGRGEQLFWSEAVNCGKCHRVGDRGTAIGPDLSGIGKLRAPDDLLDSLLAPSRRIEPKYAVYLAQTVDGRSLTGVLVHRDAKSVVLRDGEGKEAVLAAENVHELRPSRMSLMPEGQMSGLTPQQAADLLAYLATRATAASQ
jgi:putative heme-binding domain-containing protein